jgi:hypothetical protein
MEKNLIRCTHQSKLEFTGKMRQHSQIELTQAEWDTGSHFAPKVTLSAPSQLTKNAPKLRDSKGA